ncbi:unnamed protein product [Vicia faba]|uniref:Uncharacterized protein n=1 Tax=Vicia faba TaxID=3906 RepID=A0AAV1A1N2_VICFA|nr:unnamed protein product [Vicia faba]
MYVIVNDIPTKDFNVSRGLRQGYLLSLFLFLMVVEGIFGLVNNAVLLGEFKGFNFVGNLRLELSFYNLPMIQSWWEMGRGKVAGALKRYLEEAAGFLLCGIGAPSFTFLGIPIIINPKRREVWTHIMDKIRERSSVWHNRFLSIGGRVELLSSILSNMLIFLFSFYKVPKVIINEVILLQQVFLLGGAEDKKEFNFGYGEIMTLMLEELVFNARSKVSLWWKDICSVGKVEKDNPENWFTSSISCKLKKGAVISFWVHQWSGSMPFRNCFPSLYLVSDPDRMKVSDHRVIADILVASVMELAKLWLLDYLWKSKDPSKMLIFDWRLILNKLPLRMELGKRHIFVGAHNTKFRYYLVFI